MYVRVSNCVRGRLRACSCLLCDMRLNMREARGAVVSSSPGRSSQNGARRAALRCGGAPYDAPYEAAILAALPRATPPSPVSGPAPWEPGPPTPLERIARGGPGWEGALNCHWENYPASPGSARPSEDPFIRDRRRCSLVYGDAGRPWWNQERWEGLAHCASICPRKPPPHPCSQALRRGRPPNRGSQKHPQPPGGNGGAAPKPTPLTRPLPPVF